MESVAASLSSTALSSIAPVEPSRCPYCPDRAECHWTKWGTYSRYAQAAPGSPDPPAKIDVQRWWCKFVRRTFSLLADGLLPYHDARTCVLLEHAHALFVEESGSSTRARLTATARTTVRRLKASVAAVVARLRLPGHEGSLAPKAFFTQLLALGADAIVSLFRAWKEIEPKHSIVGFFPR